MPPLPPALAGRLAVFGVGTRLRPTPRVLCASECPSKNEDCEMILRLHFVPVGVVLGLLMTSASCNQASQESDDRQ